MAVEVRVRVWVQLLRGEEEAGSVSSLKPASRDLVDDLRDAVWEKNKAELGDVIPARLTVHRERGGKALRASEAVPTDTKWDTPLFVVAPQAPGAPPPPLCLLFPCVRLWVLCPSGMLVRSEFAPPGLPACGLLSFWFWPFVVLLLSGVGSVFCLFTKPASRSPE